jgi:SagB-type dehydrogenase family enzyme
VIDPVEISPLGLRYRLREVVFGEADVPLDDPAETYHEASKLSPSLLARQLSGALLLESSPGLQRLTLRAVKRYGHRPSVRLPAPTPLTMPLGEAIAGRRSGRAFASSPLPLVTLSTLLHAAFGVVDERDPLFRTAPSAGALYPLELYVVASFPDHTDPGLYHFDPLRHALEELEPGAEPIGLPGCLADPHLAAAPLAAVVTALFWRSRFKYGLRGYRFALLEAGHVVQNLLLAAGALGLAAIPIGGFYDRRLEELLGIDGVNEAAIYCVAVGHPADTGTGPE